MRWLVQNSSSPNLLGEAPLARAATLPLREDAQPNGVALGGYEVSGQSYVAQSGPGAAKCGKRVHEKDDVHSRIGINSRLLTPNDKPATGELLPRGQEVECPDSSGGRP